MTRIGFIGTGKVGQTLARLWHQSGYRIGAVYNRTPQSAEQLALAVGAIFAEQPQTVVETCDVVFITVPDGAIAPVVQQLVACEWHNKGLVHTSGAFDLSVLGLVAQRGAMVGGLHPALPFADVEQAMQAIIGATFAVETTDKRLETILGDLIHAVKGVIIRIPEGKKAQYHAALCIASNYAVTLYAVAEQLLLDLGAEADGARGALNRLMLATVQNIIAQGIPKALTGPLTRADVGTLQAHLTVLPPDVRDAYRQLARLTYPMLIARDVPIETIEMTLKQDEDHALNHT